MSLTPELEAYYDTYNELFNSKGFKQLTVDLEEQARQLADIQSVKDNDDLFFRKGQVAILAYILNLPNVVSNAREQAELEDEPPVEI
jgi:hypothetical protein